MEKCDLCVFLLGAGASAGFGLPVMDGFMDRAIAQYFRLKQNENAGKHNGDLVERYDRMLEFHRGCRESSWAFRRNWDNIEELYTQADLVRLAHTLSRSAFHEELCDDIAWVIWDVYRRKPEAIPPWGQIAQRVKDSDLHPIIITTNYDLVVEHFPMDGKHGWNWQYPGFPLSTQDKATCEPANTSKDVNLHKANHVALIKLHGSANWFEPGSLRSQYIGKGDGRWYAVRNLDVTNESVDAVFSWLPDVMPNIEGDFTPAIVPPMLSKGKDNPILNIQWETATRALAQAKFVFVIGYSFPSTDTFMPRLLAQGLKSNQNCERFIIVDIQHETQWDERLSNLFNPVFRRSRVRLWKEDSVSFLGSLPQNRIDTVAYSQR